jgi:hypothetical protein
MAKITVVRYYQDITAQIVLLQVARWDAQRSKAARKVMLVLVEITLQTCAHGELIQIPTMPINATLSRLDHLPLIVLTLVR